MNELFGSSDDDDEEEEQELAGLGSIEEPPEEAEPSLLSQDSQGSQDSVYSEYSQGSQDSPMPPVLVSASQDTQSSWEDYAVGQIPRNVPINRKPNKDRPIFEFYTFDQQIACALYFAATYATEEDLQPYAAAAGIGNLEDLKAYLNSLNTRGIYHTTSSALTVWEVLGEPGIQAIYTKGEFYDSPFRRQSYKRGAAVLDASAKELTLHEFMNIFETAYKAALRPPNTSSPRIAFLRTLMTIRDPTKPQKVDGEDSLQDLIYPYLPGWPMIIKVLQDMSDYKPSDGDSFTETVKGAIAYMQAMPKEADDRKPFFELASQYRTSGAVEPSVYLKAAFYSLYYFRAGDAVRPHALWTSFYGLKALPFAYEVAKNPRFTFEVNDLIRLDGNNDRVIRSSLPSGTYYHHEYCPLSILESAATLLVYQQGIARMIFELDKVALSLPSTDAFYFYFDMDADNWQELSLEDTGQAPMDTGAPLSRNRSSIGLRTNSTVDSVYGNVNTESYKKAKEALKNYSDPSNPNALQEEKAVLAKRKVVAAEVAQSVEAFHAHLMQGLPSNVGRPLDPIPEEVNAFRAVFQGNTIESGFFAGDSVVGIRLLPEDECEAQCVRHSIDNIREKMREYDRIISLYDSRALQQADDNGTVGIRTMLARTELAMTKLSSIQPNVAEIVGELCGLQGIEGFRANDTNLKALPGVPFDLIPDQMSSLLDEICATADASGWTTATLKPKLKRLMARLQEHLDTLEDAKQLEVKKRAHLEAGAKKANLDRSVVDKRSKFSDAYHVWSDKTEYREHSLLRIMMNIKVASRPPTFEEAIQHSNAYDTKFGMDSFVGIKGFLQKEMDSLEDQRGGHSLGDPRKVVLAEALGIRGSKDENLALAVNESVKKQLRGEPTDHTTLSGEPEGENLQGQTPLQRIQEKLEEYRKAAYQAAKDLNPQLAEADFNQAFDTRRKSGFFAKTNYSEEQKQTYPLADAAQNQRLIHYNTDGPAPPDNTWPSRIKDNGPVTFRDSPLPDIVDYCQEKIDKLLQMRDNSQGLSDFDTSLRTWLDAVQDLENAIEALHCHAFRKRYVATSNFIEFADLNSRPHDKALKEKRAGLKKAVNESNFVKSIYKVKYRIGSETQEEAFEAKFGDEFFTKEKLNSVKLYMEHLLYVLQQLGQVFRFGGFRKESASSASTDTDTMLLTPWRFANSLDAMQPRSDESNRFFSGVLHDHQPDMRTWADRMQGETFAPPVWNVRRHKQSEEEDLHKYLIVGLNSVVAEMCDIANAYKDLFDLNYAESDTFKDSNLQKVKDSTVNVKSKKKKVKEDADDVKGKLLQFYELPQSLPPHGLNGIIGFVLGQEIKTPDPPVLTLEEFDTDIFARDGGQAGEGAVEFTSIDAYKDDTDELVERVLEASASDGANRRNYADKWIEFFTDKNIELRNSSSPPRWGGTKQPDLQDAQREHRELSDRFGKAPTVENWRAVVKEESKQRGEYELVKLTLEQIRKLRQPNAGNESRDMGEWLLESHQALYNEYKVQDDNELDSVIQGLETAIATMEQKSRERNSIYNITEHLVKLKLFDKSFTHLRGNINKKLSHSIVDQLFYKIQQRGLQGLPEISVLFNRVFNQAVSEVVQLLQARAARVASEVVKNMHYSGLVSAFEDFRAKWFGHASAQLKIAGIQANQLNNAMLVMEANKDSNREDIFQRANVAAELNSLETKLKVDSPDHRRKLRALLALFYNVTLTTGFSSQTLQKNVRNSTNLVINTQTWWYKRKMSRDNTAKYQLSFDVFEGNRVLQETTTGKRKENNSYNPVVNVAGGEVNLVQFRNRRVDLRDRSQTPISLEVLKLVTTLARDTRLLFVGYERPAFLDNTEFEKFKAAFLKFQQEKGMVATEFEVYEERRKQMYTGLLEKASNFASLQRYATQFKRILTDLSNRRSEGAGNILSQEGATPMARLARRSSNTFLESDDSVTAPRPTTTQINRNEYASRGLAAIQLLYPGQDTATWLIIDFLQMYRESDYTRNKLYELARLTRNTIDAFEREYAVWERQPQAQQSAQPAQSPQAPQAPYFQSIVELLNARELQVQERRVVFFQSILQMIQQQQSSAATMLSYLEEFEDTNPPPESENSMLTDAFAELKYDLQKFADFEQHWQDVAEPLEVLRREDAYQSLKLVVGGQSSRGMSRYTNQVPFYRFYLGDSNNMYRREVDSQQGAAQVPMLGCDLASARVIEGTPFGKKNPGEVQQEDAQRESFGRIVHVQRAWEAFDPPTVAQVQSAVSELKRLRHNPANFQQRPPIRAVDVQSHFAYAFFVDLLFIELQPREQVDSRYNSNLQAAFEERMSTNEALAEQTPEHHLKLQSLYGGVLVNGQVATDNPSILPAYWNQMAARSNVSFQALQEVMYRGSLTPSQLPVAAPLPMPVQTPPTVRLDSDALQDLQRRVQLAIDRRRELGDNLDERLAQWMQAAEASKQSSYLFTTEGANNLYKAAFWTNTPLYPTPTQRPILDERLYGDTRRRGEKEWLEITLGVVQNASPADMYSNSFVQQLSKLPPNNPNPPSPSNNQAAELTKALALSPESWLGFDYADFKFQASTSRPGGAPRVREDDYYDTELGVGVGARSKLFEKKFEQRKEAMLTSLHGYLPKTESLATATAEAVLAMTQAEFREKGVPWAKASPAEESKWESNVGWNFIISPGTSDLWDDARNKMFDLVTMHYVPKEELLAVYNIPPLQPSYSFAWSDNLHGNIQADGNSLFYSILVALQAEKAEEDRIYNSVRGLRSAYSEYLRTEVSKLIDDRTWSPTENWVVGPTEGQDVFTQTWAVDSLAGIKTAEELPSLDEIKPGGKLDMVGGRLKREQHIPEIKGDSSRKDKLDGYIDYIGYDQAYATSIDLLNMAYFLKQPIIVYTVESVPVEWQYVVFGNMYGRTYAADDRRAILLMRVGTGEQNTHFYPIVPSHKKPVAEQYASELRSNANLGDE